MTDLSPTTRVVRRAHNASGNPIHFHRPDADCPHLTDAPTVETTVRKAKARGYPACGDCVGRFCPRCRTYTTTRLKSHLRDCGGGEP